jgi:integrase
VTRRGRGEGAVYFEHKSQSDCKDDRHHRGCSGKWRGEVTVRVSGKPVRKRVNGRTKTEVYTRLKDVRDELGQGVSTSATYTVEKAVGDWLADVMSDRADKTIRTQRELLDPRLDEIGETVLHDLTTDEVRDGLQAIAKTRTPRTVRHTRASLVRAITYAQARGKVGRNVASLVTPPAGQSPGRPSKSLTVVQARAVLKAAEADRLNAYVVLSLVTGVRTEEARALTWNHVDLDVPKPYVAVWRSVRAGGDVRTQKSRRTLGLSQRSIVALRAHKEAREKERADAAELCEERDLVFCTQRGGPLDAHNVRRSFRRICAAAKIGEDWTPRDLRHSFVSIMSDSGVPIEKIADLLGHTGGSRVTESVYRHQLRPVLTEGAEVMDEVLKPRGRRAVRGRADRPKD